VRSARRLHRQHCLIAVQPGWQTAGLFLDLFDRRFRLEAASLITTVTVPASESLRFNLNAGWVWSEAGPGRSTWSSIR